MYLKIDKKNSRKKKLSIFFCFSSSNFKSVKSTASGKENIRLLDIPDFEILVDIQPGHDVLSGRALPCIDQFEAGIMLYLVPLLP